MKINKKFIEEIFKLKINKLKNDKDKKKLSYFEDIIPMYDIYSEGVYPIKKENIYYRLIDCHYRFITNEIKRWIEIKYEKNKNEIHKNNINIINNYHIETLIETSYKALYENSENLGLSISICKRNSFNKYSMHLVPYYSKKELKKLGMNMNIIKEDSSIDLNNTDVHYMICLKVSKNDVSSEEMSKHNNYIIDNKLISVISNYSFMGSYFMNRYLRGQDNYISNIYIDTINKMSKAMLKSPKLNNSYFLYRFVWNDDFIKKVKIGSTFIDNGFISTTRDPFYSPGLKSSFGLILIKIKIPKELQLGLFIENFSLFPKEEEFLIPPRSKLKLLSKNDNFKYYHINNEFKNLIKTKYELELVDNSFKYIENNNDYESFKNIQIVNYPADTKIELIKLFISNNKSQDGILNLKLKNRNYKINYNWFDGSESYSKFYYNNNRNGIIFIIYDENLYPYLTIEFGDTMVVNYLNQFYYYDNKKNIDELDLELINILGYNFRYIKYNIFLEFNNFSKVSKLNNGETKEYLYCNLYCNSIYEYFKNNLKFYNNIKMIKDYTKYTFGYWKLDRLKVTKLPLELINKFNGIYTKNTSISDFVVDIVENHFYYYPRIKDMLKKYNIDNPFDSLYLEFDIKSYFKNNENSLEMDLSWENNEIENDNDFKLIFRQPTRRII